MSRNINLPILPIEIMDMIVLWACNWNVTHSLRDRITQYAFDNTGKNILIYGDHRGNKKSVHFSALKKVFIKLYKSRNTIKILK